MLDIDQWKHSHSHGIAGYDLVLDHSQCAFHYLHGLGFCGRTLYPLAKELGTKYSHLISDMPGHGQSPQPFVKQPDWNGMAATIAASIQQRYQGNLIGVGHSMGGVLTLLMAAENPSLFKQVILLDPVLFTPTVIFMQRILWKTGLSKYSPLVKNAKKRTNHWTNLAAASQSLASKGLYRDWDPIAFQEYIDSGLVVQPDDSVSLACQPEWESMVFASYPRGLWRAVAEVEVPVHIILAKQSFPFIAKSAQLASKKNTNISYSMFGSSHCFPMINPGQSTDYIRSKLYSSVS